MKNCKNNKQFVVWIKFCQIELKPKELIMIKYIFII